MTTVRQNAIRPVSRLQHVNDPEPAAFPREITLQYVRVLVDALRRIDAEMVSKDTASPYMLLASPNGTVFRVGVDDNGVLYAVNARA